jgi:RHS repeat-associated protein
LTCAYFGAVEDPFAPCATSYAYAPNGNLTFKSDVGVLSYGDPQRPHAVTGAAGELFGYDAVGNQVTRPGGVTITYAPFDLPRAITQGDKTVTFGYDGDEQRIRKATPEAETLYFGDLYEQVKSGGSVEHRYHVRSPERVVAIVTRGGAAPGTRYLHVDHIGSVNVVTKDGGVIEERRSYDAFGQRRSPKWGEAAGAFTSKTTKGFTGHEEADEFGLVNMRGRIYDPRIGRFTTTDPVIADLHDGQSFNAYSYVWNNPLKFVDPSGFEPESPPILPILQRVTAEPGGTITVDLLYPPRAGQPQRLLPELDGSTTVGAVLPPVDMDTTGPGDVIELAIVETPHPSGAGTDDPFGVFPPDITLGYADPLTTLDQLMEGDPAGGRTTFLIEDEPGFGRDLRILLGPKREVIQLRPRIGGMGDVDDREAAAGRLVVEGILLAGALLTPGVVDDIALAPIGVGGRWVRASEAMSPRAAEYQARFGRSGHAFEVNGVKFDGVRKGVLLEAKGPGYAKFVRDGRFRGWFRGRAALVKQAKDQVRVAGGAPIEWHFAEEAAANAMRALFEDEGITGIRILVTK